MDAPTHTRRHTVTVSELRRVLAASAPRSSPAHARIPTFTASPPSSPTSSAHASPGSSPPASERASPLVTPGDGPNSLPRGFDVRAAADVCRRIEGYVSFMDIEGLGAPPGLDEDAEDGGLRPKKERSWSWGAGWFGFAPPPGPGSTTCAPLKGLGEDDCADARARPLAVRAPRRST